MSIERPDFEIDDTVLLPDGVTARVVADQYPRPMVDWVHWIGPAYPDHIDPERDTWNGQWIAARTDPDSAVVILHLRCGYCGHHESGADHDAATAAYNAHACRRDPPV